MRSIVLQSFRAWDVPAWMHAAMRSVRAWAESRGHDYRFQGDTFLDYAPGWARWRLRTQMPAVTDLARLAWMRATLAEGFDRVIWADADLLVFDPERFTLPEGAGHACARELHLYLHEDGSTEPRPGINNAVMMVEAGDPFVERYLAAALAEAGRADPVTMPHTLLGPVLLARLASEQAIPLIEGVGVFGPGLMDGIAKGGNGLTREYLRHVPVPPAAANLGQTLRAITLETLHSDFDALYDRAIERLIETGGRVMGESTSQVARPSTPGGFVRP